VDVLGLNFRERPQAIPLFQRHRRLRVARHRRLQDLLRFRQSLDVIHVRMGGHQRRALGKRKVHLSNEIDDLVHGIFIPEVVDQVHVAANNLAGLVIHLDDIRKNRLPLQHECRFLGCGDEV
jgi:hypothetical protein